MTIEDRAVHPEDVFMLGCLAAIFGVLLALVLVAVVTPLALLSGWDVPRWAVALAITMWMTAGIVGGLYALGRLVIAAERWYDG